MYQRKSLAGIAKANRVPCIRDSMHTHQSLGGTHGVVGGSLRLPTIATGGMRYEGAKAAEEMKTIVDFSCPAPHTAKDTILLGHGSGGSLTADLIRSIFLPAFHNPVLNRLDDQAI